MAADARRRNTVRVESAEIAGTKISSTETTVADGGLRGRRSKASVVFDDAEDTVEVSVGGRLESLPELTATVFRVEAGCFAEMLPCSLFCYLVRRRFFTESHVIGRKNRDK